MKMFYFEWTGQSYGNDDDRSRGIAAAVKYCTDNGIDPAAAYDATLCDNDEEPKQESLDLWAGVEFAAVSEMCDGWQTLPDNVSLLWVAQ